MTQKSRIMRVPVTFYDLILNYKRKYKTKRLTDTFGICSKYMQMGERSKEFFAFTDDELFGGRKK